VAIEPKKSWQILYNLPRRQAGLPAEARSAEATNSQHTIWLRTLNEIRTFFSENPNAEFRKTFKLGRAKRKGVGGKEFLPALASCPVANAMRSASGVPPPPNFVFCFAKCAAKEYVALAPALPCAGNDKELPFVFTNVNKFDNIVIN